MQDFVEEKINEYCTMSKEKLGIIGGSGLEKLNLFQNPERQKISTPWGEPSSEILSGTIEGNSVCILSRHGFEHSITPTHVNNRANIHALKHLGCTQIIATTACGSLREEINRGDLVILDQFIDFTRHRPVTFFESFRDGSLHHTPMADPFDVNMRNALITIAQQLNLNAHVSGTVITIEGPRFSTRAESKMFRMWGADVVNMSTAPETVLANEAGIPYAAIALSTDYDCWKENEEPVSWEAVLEVFKQNIHNVTQLLIQYIKNI